MHHESVDVLTASVSRVAIFAGLLPAEQAIVASHGRLVGLAEGERLYRAGERLTHFFVVVRGRIRIVRSVAPGHDQLIRLAGPGDIVGEYPLLTGDDQWRGRSRTSPRRCAPSPTRSCGR